MVNPGVVMFVSSTFMYAIFILSYMYVLRLGQPLWLTVEVVVCLYATVLPLSDFDLARIDSSNRSDD